MILFIAARRVGSLFMVEKIKQRSRSRAGQNTRQACDCMLSFTKLLQQYITAVETAEQRLCIDTSIQASERATDSILWRDDTTDRRMRFATNYGIIVPRATPGDTRLCLLLAPPRANLPQPTFPGLTVPANAIKWLPPSTGWLRRITLRYGVRRNGAVSPWCTSVSQRPQQNNDR